MPNSTSAASTSSSIIICSICQDPLADQATSVVAASCGHVFHFDTCFVGWLKQCNRERALLQPAESVTNLTGECPNCYQRVSYQTCIKLYLSLDDDPAIMREKELQKQIENLQMALTQEQGRAEEYRIKVKSLESQVSKPVQLIKRPTLPKPTSGTSAVARKQLGSVGALEKPKLKIPARKSSGIRNTIVANATSAPSKKPKKTMSFSQTKTTTTGVRSSAKPGIGMSAPKSLTHQQVKSSTIITRSKTIQIQQRQNK